MKIEKDDFKLKRLISEMLVNEVENARSKNKKTKNKTESSDDFVKSHVFKSLTEFVIGKV
jgi:hypothetical protein